MNHDTTPTPRTDAIVSEPCAPHQVLQKWEKIIELSRLLERELAEKTNEVARLRAIALTLRNHLNSEWPDEVIEACEELDRLAPAPEEPCDCHRRERMVCDKCQKTDEPAPEYRELGPDEVICEGDEVQPKHHSRDGTWIKVWNHEIGATPEDQEAMRYRTRRPLPKSENLLDREPTEKQSEKSEDLNEDLWRIRAEGERMENGDQVKVCDEWTDWGGTLDRSWIVGEFWKEGEVRTRRPLPVQNDWRELGPDERIHTRDEYQSFSLVGDYWKEVHPWMAGNKTDRYPAYLFRTRRPLPTTNHKQISSKLVVEPKQEEMPLEDEIEEILEHSEHIDSLTGHMAFKALAKSIRYLRDEVQKLKEDR